MVKFELEKLKYPWTHHSICSNGDPREPRPTDLEKVTTTFNIVLSDTAAKVSGKLCHTKNPG